MINYIKVLFFLSMLPLTALANTSLKSDDYLLGNNKTILTVAISSKGYFPYNYEENGERKGLTIDILHYIEHNSKYDFEFIVVPWPRALYLVSQGKVDLILTLFKNKKREQIYHFIEPFYGYEANQLFSLIETKVEFSGQLQQLSPYSIGIVREYSYGESFDQASNLEKFPVLTEEVLLKLLLSKRVDVVLSNSLIFNNFILKYNLDSKIKAIKPYLQITPVYMALTKKREDAQEINKNLGLLIKKLKSTHYYQELLDKYQINFK